MQLTQKQESLISQYLRDAARRLDARLPARDREQRLRQLQSRIYRDLEGLRVVSVSDDDVLAVLRQTRPATAPKEAGGNHARAGVAPARRPKLNRPPGEAPVEPVWLGVCAYNAGRFGMKPWTLRLAAVVAGLATGPLAVLGYLAAYAEYYVSAEEREPIAYWPLVTRTIGPLLVLVILHWAGGHAEQVIAYAHERFLKEPMPPLGDWGWFWNYDGLLFFLACITVAPLAVLSGLPLANAWGLSLKRLAQATVALYGSILCFGVASILVGIILDRVHAYLQ